MPRLVLALGLLVLLSPTTSALLLNPLQPTYVQGSAAWEARAGDHTIQLECPPVDSSIVFAVDADTIIERSGCPFRIIDGADLLGSPALAVDPTDSQRMAIFSLHGCATDQGAHSWSRTASGCTAPSSSQTFTTFTSFDGGRDWKDQPYGNAGFGEGVDGIVDRDGRLYMVQLYSHNIGSDTNGESIYDYFFQLFKPQDWDPINYYSKEIQSRAPGNVIESIDLSLVTPWTRPENLEQYNQTLNETPPPSTEDDIGNRTVPVEQEDTSNDLVMAVWHERAYDHEATDTGKSSWIGAAWTDTSSRNEWHLLDVDQLIGPCRHASNAEAWNGRVYVACAVDAGYDGRRGARIGDVDIWAIDPSVEGGQKAFVAHARGIRDGELTMDMNDEGMMALASLKPSGDGPPYDQVDIDIGFSWYGRHWNGVARGGMLHNSWGGSFEEARINAMELVDGDRPTLFISYMERLTGPADADANEVNPDNPLSTSQAIEYRKSVSAWEPCGDALMALADLNVGVVRHPFEEGVVNGFTGAFNDFQDGLVSVTDEFGQSRIYFAFGDHGVVQYGTIRADAAQGPCIIPPAPILFPPPAIAPVALTTANSVGVGMVAAVAGPAGAMFGYLLLAKRRAALAAVTKSK